MIVLEDPLPVMVIVEVITGNSLARVMGVPLIPEAKVIVSLPLRKLASMIAWRNVFVPESAVLETTKPDAYTRGTTGEVRNNESRRNKHRSLAMWIFAILRK